MAKPYISDEEATRIDAKAVAGGYKALRAPSRSSWLAQILGKPTYIRSRAEALREERERVEPEAVKALKAGSDVINPAAQGHGLAELVNSVDRIVHGKGTGDDVVNVGAAIAGGVLFRAPARGKRIGVLVSEAGARNLGDPLVLKGLSDFKAQVGGRDWASLSAAERMRIKTRTGWDMSADGLPVTFPDWDISLSGRLGSLSDALAGSDVKKLFKAYPSLKDLNIHTGLASRNGSDPHVTSTSSWFTDLVRQPNVQGKSFGGEIGVSGLHWRLKSGRGKAGLVSHELGHEIQEIEGMSYGGAPRPAQYFLSRSKAAVAIDADRLPGYRAKARRASYDRTARELRRAVEQKARMEQELQWLHELNREGKLPEDVVRREQETLTKKLESANLDVAVLSDPHFAKSLAADAERYANSLYPVDPKATSSLQSHLHNLRASRLHSSRGSSSSLDTYKSLAGEAGARVAEYLSADPGSWSRTLLENLYDTPWDELYHVRYGGSKIPAGPVRSSWGAKPDILAPVRLENYEIQDIASGVDAVMSAGPGNEARQAAKGGEGEDRFAMSRNFLATDEVPESIFGIPVVQDEDAWTEADLEFFRKHPEAGGYYDMGGETPEDGSAEGAPTQADEAGDTGQYGGLTVQQKLERADELLKRWEGTDRYDEFKKRVDEMHAKYGQPAQQPGTSYLQKAEKATPWVKQGINTLYNIAAGGGGTDMGISQVLDTVHDTYQSASQSVVQAGRNKIAKFVADAGKQAAAGVGEGTLKEAGFAREVAEDLGRRGDIVLKQGAEGATEQAANLYKGANDMKKTATGLEETARAAKAAASRQARVKAMNHVIDTGYQQTLKTAARKAGIKAATKVGVQLGAKTVASSVGPAAIAAGAVESAVRQGADLADTMKNTGATWSDVGKATGDVFTTKQGWKNLGWGLLGSLKDVASSVTFGAVDNGDRLRERMMDAKGGEARGRYPGKLNNPGNVERRAERRRGEVASPHRRWARFATPQDGLREMADAIRQIADVKLAEKDQPFTIRNFAETYAPRFNGKGEPENDTDKYIRDISSTSGIGADAVLDRRNAGDMARLLKTIVRFESGVPHSEWFTDDEYRTAARELGERDGRPTGTKIAPSLPAKTRSAPGGSARSKGDR